MTAQPPFDVEDEAEDRIERGETGLRVLFTALFVLVVQAVETVLAVVVLFDLAFALITRRRPGEAVQRFAERVLAYAVEIVRYLTYLDDDAPFPFREFPEAPEGETGR